jgi:hypothetical protein
MIYISTAPEDISKVKNLAMPLLLMAYSFDKPFPELSEAATNLPRLSMMAIYGDIRSARSADIIRECRRYGYIGVVAGYGYSSVLETMRLSGTLGRANIRLYIMENNFVSDCGAYALISTAISGGDLKSRLKTAVKRFGSSRIALDFERLRHVFPLPSPDGNGSLLTSLEFSKAARRRSNKCYVSRGALCSNISHIQTAQFPLRALRRRPRPLKNENRALPHRLASGTAL